jgi:type VI protein secretion system component VasF
MRRLYPWIILCLLLALVIGLILFQSSIATFDAHLYATLTAIH